MNATVQTVRFSLRPGFEVRAALWTTDAPTDVGVVVAHGHYGQGKSGAEAQEIAHRLAARGAWVLAVDTPGVEEWEVDGRRIHFDDGAHNRGVLYARGNSAMALQLDVLRRGVDVLVAQGASRIGATGASGGAVQAFYLGWTDDRVSTAVMAATPPIPGRQQPVGALVTTSLGGRDLILTCSLGGPPRPSGCRTSSKRGLWVCQMHVFEVLAGPHSYTDAMQVRALEWFEEHLDLRSGEWVDAVPSIDLSEPIEREGQSDIEDLPSAHVRPWSPAPKTGLSPRWTCTGSGPRVVTLGLVEDGRLEAAGYERCALTLATDLSAWVEGVGKDEPLADLVLGGVASGVRQSPRCHHRLAS